MLKGKATIEFFDENGKLIRRKIEYNKVTNAVKNLVNQNYVVNAITNNGGEVASSLTPIWKNFCGLLLFTKNLDEDIIIPNKDTISYFTGNACDSSHYNSGNVYHGYFDSANSTISKDKLDLYFTFDLNSICSDIGSICLSSIQGGNCGLLGGLDSLFVSYSDKNLQTGSTCGVGLDVPSANFIPYVDNTIDGQIIGINANGNLVTMSLIDNTHIKIKLYNVKKEVNFTDTFYKIASLEEFTSIYGGTLDNLPMLEKISEQEVELINGIDDINNFSIIDNYLYATKVTNNTYYMYKIDLDTYTVSYQNTTLEIENVVNYKNIEDTLYITTTNYLYIVKLNEYKESQYLFETTYDRIEVMEENLTPIVFKDTIALLNTSAVTSGDERNIYFLTNTNIFNQNKIVFSGDCDKIVNFCFNFAEPCFGIVTNTGNISTININVFAPYLATINNISIATKYATVVMKVHYELFTTNE